MHRRVVLGLVLGSSVAGVLSACGFALRQAPDFAFSTLYAKSNETSPLAVELWRSLESTGKVQVITDAQQINQADVVLDVLENQREKVVVGTDANGRVREFQLRMRFVFRLSTPAGKELIPDAIVVQQRDIAFNESSVLAKEAEESLLYREMQNDVVQQVMRRLAALTEL